MKIVIILSLLYSSLSYCADIVLVTPDSLPYTSPKRDGLLDLIYREAFKRINLSVEIQRMPGERSLIEANNGSVDGDAFRIGGLTSKYENLIQVDESVLIYECVAFTKKKNIRVKNWQGLTPYNVAFMNGWKIFEENIKNTKSIIKVTNTKSLFQMLEMDRVDVIAHGKLDGLYLMREYGIYQVRAMSPPLARKKMYLYLNKKHDQVAKDLAIAIRSMKEDGTYSRILEDILSELELKKIK